LNEERFSEAEVAEILRRAGSDAPETGTLSRSELLLAAEEAGIDPARVETIIAEPRASVTTAWGSNRSVVKEFDFGIDPKDLPLILTELPPGAERATTQRGGLLVTTFEAKMTRFRVQCSSDGTSTQVEVHADRSRQHSTAFLIGLIGSFLLVFIGRRLGLPETFAGLVVLGLLTAIPYLVTGRNAREQIKEYAAKIEARLRAISGRVR
jgi:hypothetical protein